jgi:hypothetical protein
MALSIPPSNTTVTDVPAGDQCRLLELPAELRLRIYSLVFSTFREPNGEPTSLNCYLARKDGKFLTMFKPDWEGMNIMPLLQTCKQVQREAPSTLGEHVTFLIFLWGEPESHYEPRFNDSQNPGLANLAPFMKDVKFKLPLNNPVHRYFWEIRLICKLFQDQGRKPMVTDVLRWNPHKRPSVKRAATKRELIDRLQSFVEDSTAGEIEKNVCADIVARLRNVSVD